jgi:hypothetical protein
MAHVLNIWVKDNSFDDRFLYIEDRSIYDPYLNNDSRKLFVKVPGFEEWRELPIPINGTITATSQNLHLWDDDNLCSLPDGLYLLKFSVNPHSKVFTEVSHFRTTIIEQKMVQLSIDSMDIDTAIEDSCGNIVASKNQKAINRSISQLFVAKEVAMTDSRLADRLYNDVERILGNLKVHVASIY